MSSIPQVVRDQANMGTLQERRRRAKPLNPYYDAKYDYYDETQVRMTALLAYNLAIVDTVINCSLTLVGWFIAWQDRVVQKDTSFSPPRKFLNATNLPKNSWKSGNENEAELIEEECQRKRNIDEGLVVLSKPEPWQVALKEGQMRPKEEWVGSGQPELFESKSDGSLARGRQSVRLCAKSRRGTASAMPHSVMGGGVGLRHWGKGSMCMLVTKDARPPPGVRPRRRNG